jgi:hypothetical protein
MDLIDENTGRPMFYVYKLNMACDKCIAENKTLTCKHKADQLPEHLSSAKQEQGKMILRKIGLESSILQELMNMSAGGNARQCFPQAFIDHLFTKRENFLSEHQILYHEVPVVWTTIDPNAGGSSDIAVCSLFQDKGMANFVLLGGEAIDFIVPEHSLNWIKKHFLAIRSIPKFRNCLIYLIVENNLPSISNAITAMINNDKAIPNIVPLNRHGFDTATVELVRSNVNKHHGHRNNHGRQTTGDVKENMTTLFKDALERGAISIFDKFVCVYKRHSTEVADSAQIYLQMARTQLKAWSEIISQVPKLETALFNPVLKRTYSGKHAGADDAAVTILECVYYCHFFTTHHDDSIRTEILRVMRSGI